MRKRVGMTLEPLFESIVNLALFLELTHEDDLDPDEALTQLEDLSASLGKLDTPTRNALVEYIAKAAEDADDDDERRKALESLAADLNLLDEEDEE